ncbi:hypothetical protein BZA77DRAFT_307772 [Pyronema omphalodes]|nr:hypothetical protein BZA77DRAFT_307772 [Pyronema omphalodes]
MARGNLFPILLATVFGVVNGIYIFKPLIIEERLKRLQQEGANVGQVGYENKAEEEIALHNELAKMKFAGGNKEAAEEGKVDVVVKKE